MGRMYSLPASKNGAAIVQERKFQDVVPAQFCVHGNMHALMHYTAFVCVKVSSLSLK